MTYLEWRTDSCEWVFWTARIYPFLGHPLPSTLRAPKTLPYTLPYTPPYTLPYTLYTLPYTLCTLSYTLYTPPYTLLYTRPYTRPRARGLCDYLFWSCYFDSLLLLLGAEDLNEAGKEMMAIRYLACRKKEKELNAWKTREIEVIYKDSKKKLYNIAKHEKIWHKCIKYEHERTEGEQAVCSVDYSNIPEAQPGNGKATCRQNMQCPCIFCHIKLFTCI